MAGFDSKGNSVIAEEVLDSLDSLGAVYSLCLRYDCRMEGLEISVIMNMRNDE